VRENRTPGSVRGALGNRRPYRDAIMKWSFATTDESRIAPNEFKDLAAYFHSRRRKGAM
jgi:hypothetical protein